MENEIDDDWLHITFKRPLGHGEHVLRMVFSPQTVSGMWRELPTMHDYVSGSLVLFSARLHEEWMHADGYRILCIQGGFAGASIDLWSDPIVIEEAPPMASA